MFRHKSLRSSPRPRVRAAEWSDLVDRCQGSCAPKEVVGLYPEGMIGLSLGGFNPYALR
jgi:hypothetical protein